MRTRAALYLRSSKDRADASIAAQRRALRDLAVARKYIVVEEFSDAVESGKDDNRPGFQRLVAAVRNPNRGWDTLFVLDTARLARRRLLAIIFEEQECRRHGVSIVYKSLPEGDPITDMLLKSILQAMDEWHSMASKQKGVAGLTENVRSGYRAGGRAPLGYTLVKIATGAIREGAAVTKSKLEPSSSAPAIAHYLKDRALRVPRRVAAERAGLSSMTASTLIGIEHNALTYAGNTVWNVHAERVDGAYVGGSKRRPRSEWIVHPATHPALITEAEAEAILEALVAPKSGPKRRHRSSNSLLGGILRTPNGTSWHSDGSSYRTREGGRSSSTQRAALDAGFVGQVVEDLTSPAMLEALTSKVAKAMVDLETPSPPEPSEHEIGELDREIGRLLDLAVLSETPGPLLRRIEELERRRETIAASDER